MKVVYWLVVAGFPDGGFKLADVFLVLIPFFFGGLLLSYFQARRPIKLGLDLGL